MVKDLPIVLRAGRANHLRVENFAGQRHAGANIGIVVVFDGIGIRFAGGLYGVDYPLLWNGNSHSRALTWARAAVADIAGQG